MPDRAHRPFHGRVFPTRYEDVRAIANDTEHFSSRRVVVRETPPPRIPRAADHLRSAATTRRQAHAAAAVHAGRDQAPRAAHAKICRDADRRFAGEGRCDAAVEYAQEIPARVIAHMLGVPEDDGDLFRKWIHEILELGITDVAALMRAVTRDDGTISTPRSRSGEARRATI